MLTLRQPDLDVIARLARAGRRSLWAPVRRAAGSLRDLPPMDVVDWIHDSVFLSSSMTERPGPMRLTAIQAAGQLGQKQAAAINVALGNNKVAGFLITLPTS